MSIESRKIRNVLGMSAALVLAAGQTLAQTGAATSSSASAAPLTLKLTASAAEGYDSNLYLQDHEPDPSIVGAVKLRQESWFTTLTLNTAVDAKLSPAVGAAFSWLSEATFFTADSDEDHTIQRASLQFSGKIGEITWSVLEAITFIDGSDISPTFGGPGGAAGMGGVPLRERRDAFVNRTALRIRQPLGGSWWVRPTMTTYYHDWRTQQSRAAGYQNYVDREDWMAGADLGVRVLPKADVFVGVRRGRQDQRKLHGVDSPYDSHVLRWLFGVEGTVLPGLQCQLAIGPEVHHWINPGALPAVFDQDKVYWWIDGALTWAPTARDTIILSNKRFAMSTFGGVAYFEDITYDLIWRRKVSEQLSFALSYRAYGGTFNRPTLRQDYVLTPAVQVQYRIDKHSLVEFNHLFDRSDSRLHNTIGREYHRHVGSLAYRYTF